jgi:Tol biopolymer transport system component
LSGAGALLLTLPAAAKTPGVNGQIVYNGTHAVFTANPDGTHKRLLERNTCCASWSPDGSRIALAASGTDHRVTTAIVRPDGSQYRRLPLPGLTLNLGPASENSWSPDGRRLALQGWDNSHPRRNGVYTESAIDGSGLHRVTTNPYRSNDVPADFSPDGKRIVFFRQDPKRHNAIALFVVGVNGGHVKQITRWQHGQQGTASWSPDGRWILTGNAHGGLYVVHPNGTGWHRIPLAVKHDAFAFTPGWSPNGKKITFGLFIPTGAHTGRRAIYTANADGSHPESTGLPGDSPDWGTHPITR